ncbi:MAG: trna delta -isopentenylpyrophosphate transferase [Alphaproteobacteria bacterium]|jgi:hypothetical protein
MAKKLPARLQEILKDIGLTERQAVWDCHGTPVVLHKALEKVAAHYNVVFDQPQIIACDVAAKEAVICVTGHMAEATEWSIGEAAPYNNKNSYPFAMAEKRAKDRVILKLVGLHGDVYSEEEADDFKAAKPKEATPSMTLNIDDRVDAMLTFYENCTQEQFDKAESKYTKIINSPDLTEAQYEQVLEAHEKRKVELMT